MGGLRHLVAKRENAASTSLALACFIQQFPYGYVCFIGMFNIAGTWDQSNYEDHRDNCMRTTRPTGSGRHNSGRLGQVVTLSFYFTSVG